MQRMGKGAGIGTIESTSSVDTLTCARGWRNRRCRTAYVGGQRATENGVGYGSFVGFSVSSIIFEGVYVTYSAAKQLLDAAATPSQDPFPLPGLKTFHHAPKPRRLPFGSCAILRPALNCFSNSRSQSLMDDPLPLGLTGTAAFPGLPAPNNRRNLDCLASPPASSAAFHFAACVDWIVDAIRTWDVCLWNIPVLTSFPLIESLADSGVSVDFVAFSFLVDGASCNPSDINFRNR
jgi:hypothetical protein